MLYFWKDGELHECDHGSADIHEILDNGFAGYDCVDTDGMSDFTRYGIYNTHGSWIHKNVGTFSKVFRLALMVRGIET
jgi:hypothetical protein